MRRLIIASALVALMSSAAHAHKLSVHAVRDAGRVTVDAYFADGARCMECPVKAVSPAGVEAASGKTDGKGRFEFPCLGAGELKITVDAGGGHMGAYTLKAESLQKGIDIAALVEAGPVAPGCQEQQPIKRAVSTSPAKPSCLSAEETAAIVNAVVEARTRALMNEVQALCEATERPRVTEVIGGIGYIIGIAGIAMYMSARKRG